MTASEIRLRRRRFRRRILDENANTVYSGAVARRDTHQTTLPSYTEIPFESEPPVAPMATESAKKMAASRNDGVVSSIARS